MKKVLAAATSIVTSAVMLVSLTAPSYFPPSPTSKAVITPPAGSLNQGLIVTQSGPATGSTTGPLDYNVINVTHQSGTTGSGVSQADALRINMQVGGANLSGGPAIGVYATITEGISGVVSAIDKIGATGSCDVEIVDTAGGGCYGLNAVSVLGATASINRLVGFESDVGVKSGGLATYRYAISAVNERAGQGSTLDSAFFVGNIGGVGGAFKTMMTLSNSLGFAPLATTGDLFASDATATIANVFDMANVTVTGNILGFPNAVLTGPGKLAIGTSTPLSQFTNLQSGIGTIPALSAAPAGAEVIGSTGTNAILSVGVDSNANSWLQARDQRSNGASYNLNLQPLAGNVGIGMGSAVSPGSALQINGGLAVGYSTSTAAPSNAIQTAGGMLIDNTAAPTAGANQVAVGANTSAASSCGSLAGSAGCWNINVAGTVRHIPYY